MYLVDVPPIVYASCYIVCNGLLSYYIFPIVFCCTYLYQTSNSSIKRSIFCDQENIQAWTYFEENPASSYHNDTKLAYGMTHERWARHLTKLQTNASLIVEDLKMKLPFSKLWFYNTYRSSEFKPKGMWISC